MLLVLVITALLIAVASLTPSMQVSLGAALALWQHRLSTWLHVSLSQQILRIYKPPAGILSAGF